MNDLINWLGFSRWNFIIMLGILIFCLLSFQMECKSCYSRCQLMKYWLLCCFIKLHYFESKFIILINFLFNLKVLIKPGLLLLEKWMKSLLYILVFCYVNLPLLFKLLKVFIHFLRYFNFINYFFHIDCHLFND